MCISIPKSRQVNGQPLKVVHEMVTDKLEVAVTLSNNGFQRVSFVNSKGVRHVDHTVDQIIDNNQSKMKKSEETSGIVVDHIVDQIVDDILTEMKRSSESSGVVIKSHQRGRHVDYIVDQIIDDLLTEMKRSSESSGVMLKSHQVKRHLWIFINCLVENPVFDSQTKDCMTLKPIHFGSKFDLSDKFLTQIRRCGIVHSLNLWVACKQEAQLMKKCIAVK